MCFARRTLPSSRNLPHLLRKHNLKKSFTRAIIYPLYCDQDVLYESIDPQVAATPSTSLHSTTPSPNVKKTAKLPVHIEKECSYCFRKSDKLKKCTGCGVTWYCNRRCQSDHWTSHKKACNSAVTKVLKASTSSEVPLVAECQDVLYESQIAATSSTSLHSTTPSSTVKKTAKLPVHIEKEFSYCFRKSDELRKCTGCGVTWYCDTRCQSDHWKSHKKACNSTVMKVLKASATSEVPLVAECQDVLYESQIAAHFLYFFTFYYSFVYC